MFSISKYRLDHISLNWQKNEMKVKILMENPNLSLLVNQVKFDVSKHVDTSSMVMFVKFNQKSRSLIQKINQINGNIDNMNNSIQSMCQEICRNNEDCIVIDEINETDQKYQVFQKIVEQRKMAKFISFIRSNSAEATLENLAVKNPEDFFRKLISLLVDAFEDNYNCVIPWLNTALSNVSFVDDAVLQKILMIMNIKDDFLSKSASIRSLISNLMK